MTLTSTACVSAVRDRRAFALLGSAQTTLIYTLSAIAVPLPEIGREFTLARADLILLSAAYGLSFAGLVLFGGRLADRFGGRRSLTAGLLLFAAASAVAPLAQILGVLLAARFVQGAGAAVVAPAAMAVLRTVFPTPAAYGRAMATWGGLSVLGAAAGNLLSGVLTSLLSWRWALAEPLMVAVAALVLAPGLLPGTAPNRGRSLDLPGAVLATAGITLAGYGFLVTDGRSWLSADVLVPLLGGAALTATFRYAERRSRDPLLPPGFLGDRLRALGLAATALSACGTGMTFVVPAAGPGLVAAGDLSRLPAVRPRADRLGTRGRTARPPVRGQVRRRLGSRHGRRRAGPARGHRVRRAHALRLGPASRPGGPSGRSRRVLRRRCRPHHQGVPPEQGGLADGVLNTALELGPTVVFAVLLTVGGESTSLTATAVALAALALLHHPRTK